MLKQLLNFCAISTALLSITGYAQAQKTEVRLTKMDETGRYVGLDISANGRYALVDLSRDDFPAFEKYAIYDLVTDSASPSGIMLDGSLTAFTNRHSPVKRRTDFPSISPNGRFLYGRGQIYDRETDQLVVTGLGWTHDSVLSDGRLVYGRGAGSDVSDRNSWQEYVWNPALDSEEVITLPLNSDGLPSGILDISGNGRFAVLDEYGIFEFNSDMSAGTIVYDNVCVNSSGESPKIPIVHQRPFNLPCSDVVISDDGNYVIFTSYATNFDAGTSMSERNLFLHNRLTGETKHINSKERLPGIPERLDAHDMSDNGRYVAFSIGNQSDPFLAYVYLYDTSTEEIIQIYKDLTGEGIYTLSVANNGSVLFYGYGPDVELDTFLAELSGSPLTSDQASIDDNGYSIVSRERIGRGKYRFVFRATVVNKSSEPLTNVSATVQKSDAAGNNIIAMPIQTLTFGDIAPGESAVSNETFEISIDRTKLFSWDYVAWEIKAD